MNERDIKADLIIRIAWLILAVVTITLHFGHRAEQSANDLLKAGFTIVDPEGCEVKHFD
jgi:hypothetical protein